MGGEGGSKGILGTNTFRYMYWYSLQMLDLFKAIVELNSLAETRV